MLTNVDLHSDILSGIAMACVQLNCGREESELRQRLLSAPGGGGGLVVRSYSEQKKFPLQNNLLWALPNPNPHPNATAETVRWSGILNNAAFLFLTSSNSIGTMTRESEHTRMPH